MKRIMTNRHGVIVAIILSCLSVWTVQCVAAGKEKTTADRQSANEHWKKHNFDKINQKCSFWLHPLPRPHFGGLEAHFGRLEALFGRPKGNFLHLSTIIWLCIFSGE